MIPVKVYNTEPVHGSEYKTIAEVKYFFKNPIQSYMYTYSRNDIVTGEIIYYYVDAVQHTADRFNELGYFTYVTHDTLAPPEDQVEIVMIAHEMYNSSAGVRYNFIDIDNDIYYTVFLNFVQSRFVPLLESNAISLTEYKATKHNKNFAYNSEFEVSNPLFTKCYYKITSYEYKGETRTLRNVFSLCDSNLYWHIYTSASVSPQTMAEFIEGLNIEKIPLNF